MSNLPSDVLKPRQAMIKIMQDTTDVFVHDENLTKMAWDVLTFLDKAFLNEEIEEVTNKFVWHSSDIYPDCSDDRAADWIFVLHILNFSLWSPKDTDQWTVDELTGFLALGTAVKRAIQKGKPIWDPKYYKELYERPDDVEMIFQSDNEIIIPLLKERLTLLHEIGEILTKQFEGTFKTCLKLSKNSNALMDLLIQHFPSYQENTLQYKGTRVSLFLKPATLITDIICFFYKHEELRIVPKFQSSAMFIDYRIIQIFLDYKVLCYSDRLRKVIEENDTLEFESEENLEIIACSYVLRGQLYTKLIELIDKYKTKNPNKIKLMNSLPLCKFHILIDNFLWDYRHINDKRLMKDVLLHNVRSIHF